MARAVVLELGGSSKLGTTPAGGVKAGPSRMDSGSPPGVDTEAPMASRSKDFALFEHGRLVLYYSSRYTGSHDDNGTIACRTTMRQQPGKAFLQETECLGCRLVKISNKFPGSMENVFLPSLARNLLCRSWRRLWGRHRPVNMLVASCPYSLLLRQFRGIGCGGELVQQESPEDLTTPVYHRYGGYNLTRIGANMLC
jgi:hypothetical protein